MSGPFDPYYDYGPLRVLSKPLALCGYYGSGVPELSFALSAQTGLPLHDIERMMEHKLGQRLSTYEGTINPIEQELIGQVLNQKPYGIIMLRPQSLNNSDILKKVKKYATLMYIQRDIFVLYSNLLDIRKNQDHNRYCPLPVELNINLVQQDLNHYKPRYKKAPYTIRAMNKHPTRLCDSVFKVLDAIS